MEQIFVINTGSTSTKIALYHGKQQIFSDNLPVPLTVLEGVTNAVQQLEYRLQCVQKALLQHQVDTNTLSIISARGGPLPAVQGGAYMVSDYMIDVLTHAPLSLHESALACMIGQKLGKPAGIPVIIYDAISTNEADEIAQITGVPEVPANLRGHPLNSRMAARTIAEKTGLSYESGNFIVAHLGGSISVSAHRCGRIVDMVNAFTGPMAPQRAGRLPTDEVIKLCYSGKYTYDELRRKLNGKSGFMGYFGTQDSREVFELARKGDRQASLVIRAMAYQVAKGIAEMRIALQTPSDAVILTGGMAHSSEFTGLIARQVDFLGPVHILPGEMEMDALAEGGLRVLQGLETAKCYDAIPAGYSSKEQFYKAIGKEVTA